MCGRYTLSLTREELLQELAELGLESVPELAPRFNIAPSQQAPVVGKREGEPAPSVVLMRWGLVPHWAKDPSIGNRMINARFETAATKNAFRSAFRKRRCLVLADGFYEWKRLDGRKQPIYFHRQRPPERAPARGGALLTLAGLWSSWRRESEPPLYTYTILTRPSTGIVADVHDRMPVVVAPEQRSSWIDPTLNDPEAASALLAPAEPALLEAYPVSTFVNAPAHEGPDCIARQEGAH